MIPLGLGAYSPPPPNIQAVLQNASQSSGVPVNILQALAYQESSYNPNAVPPNCTGQNCGQGLLQVTPATGASLGLSNPFDPQQNANAGASYLMSLYNQFGDWNSALVAYNEGPGAFQKSGAYPSSAAYASTILSNAGVSSDSGSSPISPDNSTPADSTGDGTDTSSSASFLSSFSAPEIAIGAGIGLLVLVLIARR